MQVSREGIINEIYSSPKIAEAISKMNPPDLRDDLKQEIAVIICKMSEERLVDMYNKKYLIWYCAKAISQMIKSDKSTFYNTFRKFQDITSEFDQNFDMKDSDQSTTPDPALVTAKIKLLPSIEQECIKAYLIEGSSCNIKKETRISNVKKQTGLSYEKAKMNTQRALEKVRINSSPIDGNHIVSCKIEFDLYMREKQTPDNMMEAMDELQKFAAERFDNVTVSDKYGLFIHKTKEARLI